MCKCLIFKWAQQGMILWLPDYESGALTNWAIGPEISWWILFSIQGGYLIWISKNVFFGVQVYLILRSFTNKIIKFPWILFIKHIDT